MKRSIFIVALLIAPNVYAQGGGRKFCSVSFTQAPTNPSPTCA